MTLAQDFAFLFTDQTLWDEMRAAMLPVVYPVFREAFLVGSELGALQRPTRDRVAAQKALAGYRDVAGSGKAQGRGRLQPGDPTVIPYDFEAVNSAADTVIANYTDEWWKQFSDSTQRTMRRIIANAERLGLGPAEVAKQLEPLFGAVRAQRIAVSELTNVLGMGAQETYRHAGYGYWEWRTVRDSAVDPICRSRDRRRYPMSVTFRRAHVNCRCIAEGTLVSATGILSVMSRQYEGEMITVVTASGNHLTVTPNHPIATSAGWLAAADLREGVDVLRDLTWSEGNILVDPSNMKRPSRIEDVCEAFRESPFSTRATMESSPEDFHGDGGQCEVEVVSADRPLGLRGEPQFFKGVHESAFRSIHRCAVFDGQSAVGHLNVRSDAASQSIVSAIGLILSRTAVTLTPDEAAGLTSATRSDASSEQAILNKPARHSKTLSKARHTLTPLITGDDRRSIDIAEVTLLDDINLMERAVQGTLGNASGGEDIREVIPSAIALDRVVEIRVGRARCHVYNLETVPGWYTASGIVTHNCWPVPQGKPTAERFISAV